MGDKTAVKNASIWNLDMIGSLVRREELDGISYIVVPMVMILEGVHTGSQGPVYYSMDELAKTPKMWNLKPIVIEHPFRGDTATDLEVYKKQAVGFIMNTHFIDGKLKAEAWIDEARASQKCPELLDHIEHRLPMEISTGLFSELIMDEGVWNGEPYKGRIVNIRADHLAILPTKQGACSLSDGAGLLINQSFENTDSPKEKTVLNILSTIANAQQYVAGSYVVEGLEPEEKEQHNKTDDKNRHPKNKDASEEPMKAKVEDPLKQQVYTTPDGFVITITPPKNADFEIPEQSFNDVPEALTDEPDGFRETEPISDNPTIIDEDDEEDGTDEYIELLDNARRIIENLNETKAKGAVEDGELPTNPATFTRTEQQTQGEITPGLVDYIGTGKGPTVGGRPAYGNRKEIKGRTVDQIISDLSGDSLRDATGYLNRDAFLGQYDKFNNPVLAELFVRDDQQSRRRYIAEIERQQRNLSEPLRELTGNGGFATIKRWLTGIEDGTMTGEFTQEDVDSLKTAMNHYDKLQKMKKGLMDAHSLYYRSVGATNDDVRGGDAQSRYVGSIDSPGIVGSPRFTNSELGLVIGRVGRNTSLMDTAAKMLRRGYPAKDYNPDVVRWLRAFDVPGASDSEYEARLNLAKAAYAYSAHLSTGVIKDFKDEYEKEFVEIPSNPSQRWLKAKEAADANMAEINAVEERYASAFENPSLGYTDQELNDIKSFLGSAFDELNERGAQSLRDVVDQTEAIQDLSQFLNQWYNVIDLEQNQTYQDDFIRKLSNLYNAYKNSTNSILQFPAELIPKVLEEMDRFGLCDFPSTGEKWKELRDMLILSQKLEEHPTRESTVDDFDKLNELQGYLVDNVNKAFAELSQKQIDSTLSKVNTSREKRGDSGFDYVDFITAMVKSEIPDQILADDFDAFRNKYMGKLTSLVAENKNGGVLSSLLRGIKGKGKPTLAEAKGIITDYVIPEWIGSLKRVLEYTPLGDLPASEDYYPDYDNTGFTSDTPTNLERDGQRVGPTVTEKRFRDYLSKHLDRLKQVTKGIKPKTSFGSNAPNDVRVTA